MSGSVNKVILIGNIASDVETKTMQSGDRVSNFSMATNESWKDKATGEKKQRAEFHRVVVFNQGLINVCENYLKKGMKVYVEGQVETRNYEKDGQKFYTTEIVLRPFRGEITMLESKGGAEQSHSTASSHAQTSTYSQPSRAPIDELEDEIPF